MHYKADDKHVQARHRNVGHSRLAGDAAFIPSSTFTGSKKGFIFTTRDSRTGYYRDSAPRAKSPPSYETYKNPNDKSVFPFWLLAVIIGFILAVGTYFLFISRRRKKGPEFGFQFY